MKRTLLAIALFVLFMLGSFIWFVATWDASREDPVVLLAPQPQQPFRRAGFTPPAPSTMPAVLPYACQTQTIPQPDRTT